MSARSIQAGKAVIVVDILDRTKASFNKIANGLMKSSRALRDVGTNAAGATLLTGIAAKNVIGTYVKFEDQMLSLSAKLGMFGVVTQKQDMILKGLESTIINLGKQTSYTSAEVADAAISLAQAGFSANEITSSLQSVLDLARGTGYELGASADLLANAIRTFDLFGKNDSVELRMQKINQVSSQFVKATRLGTIEIEDLRESLKYASGSAHNLGIELPVVLGFLVQMSESGLKASLAGTSLNTALLNMIKNSEKLRGIDPNFAPTTDAGGNMDMAKTFNDIMKMTNKMSKLKKVEVFGDIFNIRGARMVSSVQEMEQVENFIKQISLAGEEARLSAAKMESGVGGAIRRATSSWEALEIAMGRVFKNEATAIGNFSTLIMDNFEGIIQRNKKLIAGFLLSPIVFGAMAVSALSLSFILARLSTVISGLSLAFKGLKSVGGVMAGGAKSLASPIQAMAKSQSIKSAAIKTQAARVAKIQTSVDVMYAKAGAKKTAAARATATAKVAGSKRVASLASATSSLQKMRGATVGGRISGAVSSVRGVGSAIAGKASLIAQTVAEKSFYSKRATMYSKHAAMMLKKQQYHSTVGKIIQKRGVGDPRAEFASAAKARAAKTASLGKAANASKMAKGASVSKSIMSGFSFAKSFAGIGKGISSIAQLAFGFAKLAGSLTKFVFSWNFVGLALNALLMFGHKIPVVKKAFDDVGNGISRAFGQIAKIATYAKPAIDLFTLAFEAFVSGDTQTGMDALTTGFSGLVAIIQNQLTAAWNSFMSQVSYLWQTLQVIGQTIMMVVDSIITGVSSITGALSSRLMQGLTDMFSGSGGSTFGESMVAIIGNIAFTIDNLLTGFFKIVITLNEYLLKFLDKLQYVLGEVISKIPGTGSGGQQLMDSATSNSNITEIEGGRARANLNRDSNLRKKELAKTLAGSMVDKSKDYSKKAVDANLDSQKESNILSNRMQMLTEQFKNNMLIKQAELQGQMNAKGSVGVSTPVAAQPIQQFGSKLESLIGSVGETRARFKVTSEKTMEDLSKDQLQELRGIKSAITTAGSF